MSDELTFNASDKGFTPDSPISLQNGLRLNNNQLTIFNNKHMPKFNRVSDELTFNTFDNDDAPKSPILQ